MQLKLTIPVVRDFSTGAALPTPLAVYPEGIEVWPAGIDDTAFSGRERSDRVETDHTSM